MLASDVLALLDAGSGKQAAQPRCPSPTPPQASRSGDQRPGLPQPSLGASRRTAPGVAGTSGGNHDSCQPAGAPAGRPVSIPGVHWRGRARDQGGRLATQPSRGRVPFRATASRRFRWPPSPQERQKRPRLCHTHLVHTGSPDEQLARQCSSILPTPALPEQATSAVTPTADAAGGAALASDTLPWQASYLMGYVQRCLEALTAMYPQCAPIQTRTRASQMAVALFRCAACNGRYTAGTHTMLLVGWWSQLVQQWPAVYGGPAGEH